LYRRAPNGQRWVRTRVAPVLQKFNTSPESPRAERPTTRFRLIVVAVHCLRECGAILRGEYWGALRSSEAEASGGSVVRFHPYRLTRNRASWGSAVPGKSPPRNRAGQRHYRDAGVRKSTATSDAVDTRVGMDARNHRLIFYGISVAQPLTMRRLSSQSVRSDCGGTSHLPAGWTVQEVRTPVAASST
jgi:hypothetical protein